jgi:hypothetical protein
LCRPGKLGDITERIITAQFLRAAIPIPNPGVYSRKGIGQ